MPKRERYHLSAAQMERLLEASKPSPMIMLQCGNPMSPQEKSNLVWISLGKEMGFQAMTVKPDGSGDAHAFTALTVEPIT